MYECGGGSRIAEIKEKISENNYHLLRIREKIGHGEGENKRFREYYAVRSVKHAKLKDSEN